MRIGANIVSEFDEFSVNYTEDMTKCVPYYQKLLSLFTENLPTDFKPTRVLDLGCGNGNVTAQLIQSFPNAQYELLDASNQMINLCKNRFKGYYTDYHTTFFNDFPFSENTYDMVVAGFSIHHCDPSEKQELFQKIYDSLKPKGLLCFTDLMIDRNAEEHTPFLEEWKAFVLKNYPNSDKWEWLMEHYAKFDKPDPFDKQIIWLQNAGFTKIEPFVNDNYWVYIRAFK